MKNKRGKKGFSLTEVLLAVGTLAIGMIFVAGVFPVGIHLTTTACDRTIATVAAEEAFAKVRIFGIDLRSPPWPPAPPFGCLDFNDVQLVVLPPEKEQQKFLYPSSEEIPAARKQYCWSALCRLLTPPHAQVTVFVCRRLGGGGYWKREADGKPTATGEHPKPILVEVLPGNLRNELTIVDPFIESQDDGVPEKGFVNDNYTIVDDATGQLYRVLERNPESSTIVLDRDWTGPSLGRVWVIPPPPTGGRYPVIAIYQRIIRFQAFQGK